MMKPTACVSALAIAMALSLGAIACENDLEDNIEDKADEIEDKVD